MTATTGLLTPEGLQVSDYQLLSVTIGYYQLLSVTLTPEGLQVSDMFVPCVCAYVCVRLQLWQRTAVLGYSCVRLELC